MMDAIETGPFLVVSLDDPPGRFRYVRALEHRFLGLGVGFPAPARLEVHRRQLPLLDRIVDAHLEAQMLLLVRNREPIFDDFYAGADEHFLELRHGAEEFL